MRESISGAPERSRGAFLAKDACETFTFTGQHSGEMSQTPSSQDVCRALTIYLVNDSLQPGTAMRLGIQQGPKSQVLVYPLLAHKVGSVGFNLHFTEEAQRGYLTCPWSHSR